MCSGHLTTWPRRLRPASRSRLPVTPSIRGKARDVAIDAAYRAGALLRQHLTMVREIRHKGTIDIVTDADVKSEALIRETILSSFPTHSILGEEGGDVEGSEPEWRWIVDPLDGTTNYAHGFPFFCVSIALEVAGQLEVGVIYDPTLDELFVATRGGGTTLNGRRVRVSERDDLEACLLATGFPYDRVLFPSALRAFETLSLRCQAVRRAGSAALDMAYVACGRFDGYWELVVRPWDVAAGALLVLEAGGFVTKLNQTAFTPVCGQVLASNGAVHAAMVEGLAASGALS